MRPSACCSKSRADAASGELQPNMRKIAQSCKTARSREAIADNPCCCREITEIALSWVGRYGAMPRQETGSSAVANPYGAARLLEDHTFKLGPGADKFSISTIPAPNKAFINDPATDRGDHRYIFFMRARLAPSRIFMRRSIGLGAMVCLFHGDYGPPDPAFNLGSGSTWVVDANSLKEARNLGEAEAIQRHLLRGEVVSWCDQGYAWVDQDAVVWFYFAAFLFVILPYLLMRARAWAKGVSQSNFRAQRLAGRPRFPR